MTFQKPGVYRVSHLDVARAGAWTLSAFGPVDFGGKDALVAALRTLSSRGPSGRIGLVANPDSARWIFDPDRLIGSIEEINPVSDSEISATLAQLLRDRDERLPIWVKIAGNRLFVFLEHGLGDGRLTLDLSLALTDDTRSGVAPVWQKEAVTRFAVAKALFRAVMSNPRLPFDALRKQPAEQSEPATEPWEPAPAAAYVRGGQEAMNDLNRWKEANAPAATTAALFMAAKVRALREVGLDPYRTVHILFDGRRYLPKDSNVISNFAGGLDIHLDDPGDPMQVFSAIREYTTAGRPAVNLATTTVKVAAGTVRRKRSTAHRQLVAVNPRPRLAFSDMGRPPQLTAMPWLTTDPAQAHYAAMVKSASPEAITFSGGRLFGGAIDTASFHDNVFDHDLIQKAVYSAVMDPARLLAAKDL
jgi:hypothetical protein